MWCYSDFSSVMLIFVMISSILLMFFILYYCSLFLYKLRNYRRKLHNKNWFFFLQDVLYIHLLFYLIIIISFYFLKNWFFLSSRYFLDNAKRICHHEYVPTRGDILRTRARTTGTVEFTFKDRGSVFTIVDVGGQRSQRMKWFDISRVPAIRSIKIIQWVSCI